MTLSPVHCHPGSSHGPGGLGEGRHVDRKEQGLLGHMWLLVKDLGKSSASLFPSRYNHGNHTSGGQSGITDMHP